MGSREAKNKADKNRTKVAENHWRSIHAVKAGRAAEEREKKKRELKERIREIEDPEKMRKELEQFAPKIREIEATMRKREQQIEATKDKMNTVEDRVFKDFCRNIGVSNIRQYEERELKTQQERAKKKLEFENQINRITTQLEYEQKRETPM